MTRRLLLCFSVPPQLLRLQSDLDKSQLNEKQLIHKLEVQTETLNNKMEELRALNEQTQSSMTSEMMEVQLKVMELETVKVRGGSTCGLSWKLLTQSLLKNLGFHERFWFIYLFFLNRVFWSAVICFCAAGRVGAGRSGVSVPAAAAGTGCLHPAAAAAAGHRREGGKRKRSRFLV